MPQYPEFRKLRTSTGNNEPVTLSDARTQLITADDSQNAYISGLCTTAREDAENYTRRALVNSSYALKLANFPLVIELPVGGPVSNVSIAYVDANGDTQTLDSNTYVIQQAQDSFPQIAPVTCFPATKCQPDAVTVTWDVTSPPVPQSLKHSMLLTLSILFEQRTPETTDTDAIETLRKSYRLPW